MDLSSFFDQSHIISAVLASAIAAFSVKLPEWIKNAKENSLINRYHDTIKTVYGIIDPIIAASLKGEAKSGLGKLELADSPEARREPPGSADSEAGEPLQRLATPIRQPSAGESLQRLTYEEIKKKVMEVSQSGLSELDARAIAHFIVKKFDLSKVLS